MCFVLIALERSFGPPIRSVLRPLPCLLRLSSSLSGVRGLISVRSVFPFRRRHLFSFFFAILSPSIAARRESAMGSERRRRRRRRGRKEALRHRAFCCCCLSLPSAQIPPGALLSAAVAAVATISPSARFSRRDFPMRHCV